MNFQKKKILKYLFKIATQSSLDCDCNIIYNRNAFDEDADYDEEDSPEFPSVESLFEGSGIRMMFKDQPYSACVTKDGNVVGALVAHQDGYWEWGEEPIPVYYFSRVVSPSCQGKGIAKKLLADFMLNYRGCIIKSETHNRVLDNSLLAAGFREEWEESSGGASIKLHTFVPKSMREDYFSENNEDEASDGRKLARLRLLNLISKAG
jgi:GNAT superfamily N-acetyltransferase